MLAKISAAAKKAADDAEERGEEPAKIATAAGAAAVDAAKEEATDVLVDNPDKVNVDNKTKHKCLVPECGWTGPKASALIVHMLMHVNVKPFKCQQQGYELLLITRPT